LFFNSVANVVSFAEHLVNDVSSLLFLAVISEPEMDLVVLGGTFVPVLVSVSVNSIGTLLFPHLGGVGTNDGSIDCNWIPCWSCWPASVSSLAHPVVMSFFHWVLIITTFVVVEVSTSADIASIKLVVFFNVVWEINLNLLGSSLAVGIVSKISLGATEVVASIHVVNSFNFLLEKIFVVLKHISNVHWETNGSNGNRVVSSFTQNLNVSFLGFWDIISVSNSVIWEVVDKICSVGVLTSIIPSKKSFVGSKRNIASAIIGVDDIDSSNRLSEGSTGDSGEDIDLSFFFKVVSNSDGMDIINIESSI